MSDTEPHTHEHMYLPAKRLAPPGSVPPGSAIDPEILAPDEDASTRSSYSSRQHKVFGSQMHFANFTIGGLSGIGGHDGCLPGYITLFLVGVCLLRFGLLAAIGFVVFYGIGCAAVAVARMQSLMKGRLSPFIDPTTPLGRWTPRCLVWTLCFCMTVWLA